MDEIEEVKENLSSQIQNASIYGENYQKRQGSNAQINNITKHEINPNLREQQRNIKFDLEDKRKNVSSLFLRNLNLQTESDIEENKINKENQRSKIKKFTNKNKNEKKIKNNIKQVESIKEEFSPRSPKSAKQKIMDDLNTQKSPGYEKYRKGFEATSRGNILLAQNHHQAKLIKKIDFEDIENKEFCDCCGLPVEGVSYSIKCNVDEFADFGIGFSLYFIYLKFVIILLSLAFLPFGLTM